ncbi:uncharacterized protein LOC128272559 [Anopheles cruzii]|uniref:uncharacterized protein LOC128272559 n=1 Tax=Anopheles cruzii TaxID=68878 RepID=UPI0022EC71F1|nr:uncharacterized protein LOC128272559 [Anopheles cruzii]
MRGIAVLMPLLAFAAVSGENDNGPLAMSLMEMRISASGVEGSVDQDTGSWECSRAGRFVNPNDSSCRTYLTCISSGADGVLHERQDECSKGALFSGRYQRCISGDNCSSLEDSYAIEYECSECGKFVLPTSTDCRLFVNCLKTKDLGVFVPIKQRCPNGKVFSPLVHACVLEDEYSCESPMASAPAALLSTPIMTTVTDSLSVGRPGAYISDFVCLGPGHFPDESVPHCRGFRLCTAVDDAATQPLPQRTDGHATNGHHLLVSRSFLCDIGSVFSEVEKRCVPVADYQCPDDGVESFRCTAVGRYPDRDALGCGSYYHCQRTTAGTLKAVLEQCPIGTVFSWLTTRCVPAAEYVCPVVVNVESIDQKAVPVHVTEPLDEANTLAQAKVKKDEDDYGNRCVKSGRFANEEDAFCRTYYICTRDPGGAWVQVFVQCPAGTIFSRAAVRCVGGEIDPLFCHPQTTPVTSLEVPRRCGHARASDPIEEQQQTETDNNDIASGELDGCYEPSEPLGSGDQLDKAPWLTWSVTDSVEVADLVEEWGDVLAATTMTLPYSMPEYPCTATGRFADINSVDCRSYFICTLQYKQQLEHQVLVSVHMTCPTGMFFSSNVNKCVVSNRSAC